MADIHPGIQKQIAKFSFSEHIPAHNNLSRSRYDTQGLDRDSKNLGAFIEEKFGFSFKEASSQEREQDIDGYFQMTGDFSSPCDFIGGPLNSNVGFSLTLRDFWRYMPNKFLFYFRRREINGSLHYTDYFYYLSPKGYAIAKNLLCSHFAKFPFLDTKVTLKEIYDTSEFQALKKHIASRAFLYLNREKNWRMYLEIEIPRSNSEEGGGQWERPVAESICVKFWYPAKAVEVFQI